MYLPVYIHVFGHIPWYRCRSWRTAPGGTIPFATLLDVGLNSVVRQAYNKVYLISHLVDPTLPLSCWSPCDRNDQITKWSDNQSGAVLYLSVAVKNNSLTHMWGPLPRTENVCLCSFNIPATLTSEMPLFLMWRRMSERKQNLWLSLNANL